jgi:2-oxoisovalerate dehydrogenase E1 component
MSSPADNVTELHPVAEPTADELRWMYRVGSRSRVLEEHVVRLVARGEVKFAIWGPGEEVFGVAMALALSKTCDPTKFGVVPHYRSASFVSGWCELHGVERFSERVLRQQFSRGTDEMSGGRQMVYHLDLPEVGILPVQSPVGMQLGKAAGWALGYKKKGVHDGVAVAICGDGTTAEGDLHDAMNAASVWHLPLVIVVTDNAVAISTKPEEGRGIKDFASYAEAFGFAFFSCDGRDFLESYRTMHKVGRLAREEQRPVFVHVHSLPRFNGHSSAADVTFDLSQEDPLIAWGQQLVKAGVLKPEDVLRRRSGTQGRDFFAHHDLGAVMEEEERAVRQLIDQVRHEPHPDAVKLHEHVYAPFPQREETKPGPGDTCISYAGAIRSALDKLIARRGGHAVGEDIGRLGGVMTATAGLKKRHPNSVIDSPLNEPLVCGVSTGLGLHRGLMGLPEIQFGDYSFNAFHWFVYWGTMNWSTLGQSRPHLLLRMPTDPFGGGAMYHSMSCDGYFTAIPGIVVIMPSTSFDAHGLMLAAGEFEGPVICLEPKWLYRQNLGPAFPGEPTDPDGIAALKKTIMRGEVPELPDVFVPFGKGAVRRPGRDVTIVAWGRAVYRSLEAASLLAAHGVDAEVIDLRTLVPPDLELVRESVGRTGRLVVAAEDRPFAGFVRAIQGAVVEALPGTPTRAVGQDDLPGIAQSLVLEEAQTLSTERVVHAVHAVLGEKTGAAVPVFVPHRYWIS